MTVHAQGCVGADAPQLHLERNDVLVGAAFELARARIVWPDGSNSEGWGRDADLDLAGLKAVAEAVERQAYATLPRSAFEARADGLAAWLDPMLLVRYDQDQRTAEDFPFTDFDPAQRRWWIPATGVHDGQNTLVLADTVCGPRAFDCGYRAQLVTWATTSGCASGSGIDEAIERATLELVERDAFMRHWFAQAPGRALEFASLPDWAMRRLTALHERGCRAGVQWLTLGVLPVLLAWAQHEARAFTCVGSACGTHAEAALAGALDELETLALARAEGVPETAIAPRDVRTPADHGALYAMPGNFRDADAVLAPARVTGEAEFRQFRAALPAHAQAVYARLQRCGHPVSWVDLSLPDTQRLVGMRLHTVRAVAPGLVPIAFGHGLQPHGMVETIAHGARRLHPFC